LVIAQDSGNRGNESYQADSLARLEAKYGDPPAAQELIGKGCGEPPYGIEGWLASAYQIAGQPERGVERWRGQLAHGRKTQIFTRGSLVLALTAAGSAEEAMTIASL
jgi:hypothetical protein